MAKQYQAGTSQQQPTPNVRSSRLCSCARTSTHRQGFVVLAGCCRHHCCRHHSAVVAHQLSASSSLKLWVAPVSTHSRPLCRNVLLGVGVPRTPTNPNIAVPLSEG